jgi:hypothetical protein
MRLRLRIFRRLLPGVCAACLGAAPFLAVSADAARIGALVKGGAPKLALKLLDKEQTSGLPGAQWIALERQRLAIYDALHDWDAIAHRVQALPPDLPADFRQHALEQAAQARLAANDAEGARRFLRRLIWQEPADASKLAHWRRLVIRSYLLEDNLADAQRALLRYKQDYQAKGDVWQVLHAEILLRAGSHKAAFEMLAGVQSFEARLLRLLASLRAGQYRPRDALAEAEKLAGQLHAQPVWQRRAWVLAAHAAAAAKDFGAHVRALEKALALAPSPGEPPMFRVRPDDLWPAYDRLAEATGNAARLLVGHDSAWIKKAEAYACSDRPRARALYAFLGRRAADAAARTLAHQRLADGLLEAGLGHTLQGLYTESRRYPDISAIPETVRYRLADKALADFNIQLAARLVKDLTDPPEGEDAELWGLRRARMLVYAGDYKPALALLSDVLNKHRRLESELSDRYLQVLFDLQAVDRHPEAAALLEGVYARTDNERLRREILFWQADSKSALGQYQEAAELYLRSATHNGATGEDPWGHTARFHAAETLAKAGLVEDARSVYQKLLKSTPDPRRRAQIERNIQQLWLSRRPTTP